MWIWVLVLGRLRFWRCLVCGGWAVLRLRQVFSRGTKGLCFLCGVEAKHSLLRCFLSLFLGVFVA